MLDNCAEIYIEGETKPVVLLELDEVYHINFRCDLTSQLVAKITHDVMLIDADIIIGPDFYYDPDAGLVYGEQALGLYFATIVQAVQNAAIKQEEQLDDSVYIVKEPIYAYGNKENKNNRLQRLWGTDLE